MGGVACSALAPCQPGEVTWPSWLGRARQHAPRGAAPKLSQEEEDVVELLSALAASLLSPPGSALFGREGAPVGLYEEAFAIDD